MKKSNGHDDIMAKKLVHFDIFLSNRYNESMHAEVDLKTFESFLQSKYYIGIIFLITLMAWSFNWATPPYAFNVYNMMIVFLLILFNTLILGLFKNTQYSVPLVFSVLFIINESNISFENVNGLGFPIVSTSLAIAGYSVYFIRFKPIIRLKTFALGFILIAVSYLIPLIGIPYSNSSLAISIMGLIYLFFYLFYSNTMRSDLNYLFIVLYVINFLLIYQVGYYLYQGYMLNPDLPFDERLTIGWDRNLGWGNINDVCFYMVLTMPSHLYFVYKKPRSIVRWLLVLLPIFAVILTKSRGGLLGLVIALIGLFILMYRKGFRIPIRQILAGLVVISAIGLLAQDIIAVWFDRVKELMQLGIDGFTSYRLFIYKEAWKIFLERPIFGSGWISITRVADAWYETFGIEHRIFMYHSTLFQAIAAMGLFGLFALIIHYKQLFTFFIKDITFEKHLFLIGFIATQVHGLIENVQYSVPYSVLIAIILALFENAVTKTQFDMIDGRYQWMKKS